VREGYDRASTNRIAHAAGVSIGSLYQYFPSKEALVAAVIDRHTQETIRLIRGALIKVAMQPVEEAKHELVKLGVDALRVNPKLHRVLTEQVPRVGRLDDVQAIDREAYVLVRAATGDRAGGARQGQGRDQSRQVEAVVGQAKRFAAEIVQGVKQATTTMKQLALEGLRHELDEMVPLVRQVMKQTRARIFRGNTRSEGKLVSLFEPSTEIIRKGKASKPTEFGKMVKLQEAENQIITAYEVYPERPYDSDLLIPAIDTHHALLGRVPRLVAADAAFYSARNEAAAKAKGVKRVCIPNRSTKSPERKREQKKRWFRNGQKWRTGCEGRISVVKRRHGLSRCRYKGPAGMDRWVGFGVIADNLINIGRVMEQAAEP
jgi:transposase, IS5 family